ncbi:MAG: P-II family nitrogen regulator [Cyclonatronaceae bacterium]
MTQFNNKKLLVSIVDKGKGSKIVAATKANGCEGGTVIPGQGTRFEAVGSFFGFNFDPEKEIILSLTDEKNALNLLEKVIHVGNMKEKGHGIAFILDVCSVAGIAHLLQQKGGKPESETDSSG